MTDIISIGEQYIKLKEEEKRISNDSKKLNKKIKEYFDTQGTAELVVGDNVIVKQVQDRSTMNEDKLLNKLKQLGKTSAIKTKEYVDVEVVDNLLYKGDISTNDIIDCINNKQVTMIRIKNNK